MKYLYSEKNELKYGELNVSSHCNNNVYILSSNLYSIPYVCTDKTAAVKFKSKPCKIAIKCEHPDLLDFNHYTELSERQYITEYFTQLSEWNARHSIATELYLLPNLLREYGKDYYYARLSGSLATLSILDNLFNIGLLDEITLCLSYMNMCDFDGLIEQMVNIGNILEDGRTK